MADKAALKQRDRTRGRSRRNRDPADDENMSNAKLRKTVLALLKLINLPSHVYKGQCMDNTEDVSKGLLTSFSILSLNVS